MKQPSRSQQKVYMIHVATVPETFWALFRGQFKYLVSKGINIIGISSKGKMLEEVSKRENIPVYAVPMIPGIAPIADLKALYILTKLIKRLKPTIVNGHTPKAAFLSMIASTISFVPIRIYGCHGLITEIGTKRTRYIMKAIEWLTCRCAHLVFADSSSVKQNMIQEGLCPATKIKVLGQGTINGIDCNRFNRNYLAISQLAEFRRKHNIIGGSQIIGFIGRIIYDKGIRELLGAWKLLKEEFSGLHLLIIGPLQYQHPIDEITEYQIKHDPRIHYIEWLDDVVPAYLVMDIFILPSARNREGFPYVPMEAAAMELPVVTTRTIGCVDAVVDGVTGILVPPRDPIALADAIRKLLKDPELRQRMGKAGRERVVRDFKPEDIWEALYQEYVRLLKEKGIPVPHPESA